MFLTLGLRIILIPVYPPQFRWSLRMELASTLKEFDSFISDDEDKFCVCLLKSRIIIQKFEDLWDAVQFMDQDALNIQCALWAPGGLKITNGEVEVYGPAGNAMLRSLGFCLISSETGEPLELKKRRVSFSRENRQHDYDVAEQGPLSPPNYHKMYGPEDFPWLFDGSTGCGKSWADIVRG